MNKSILREISIVFLISCWFSVFGGNLGSIQQANLLPEGGLMLTPKIQESIFDNQLWSYTWGTSATEAGSSVWFDGTYIYTVGNVLDQYQLVKWHTDGSQLWNKSWSRMDDNVRAVWSDGTYIYTVGDIQNQFTGMINTCIYKWNGTGVEQWHSNFNNSRPNYGFAITGAGGAIYTAGYTSTVSNPDILLIKWDANGEEVWNRTWGSAMGYNDQGFSIWIEGTQVYVAGATKINSGDDMVLVKWDVNGVFQWSQTRVTTNNDRAQGVWGSGTDVYTCGWITTVGGEMVVQKWDSSGGSVWNRTWGGPTSTEMGYSIMGDGTNIYTCGSTNGFGANGIDLVQVKWDTNGNRIWYQTWGGAGSDIGRGIWCSSTTIYICGETSSFGAGGLDMLLIKCDPDRKPIVDFSRDLPPAYVNVPVQFTYNGTEGDGIVSYQWNFGDGSSNETIRNPVHTFTAANAFIVNCSVVDADGDGGKKSRSVLVTIDILPSPDFTANITFVDLGFSVAFNHPGSDGNGPATFQWNFGDSTANATLENVTHAYSLPGNYTVILTVTDVDGDMETMIKPGFIYVNSTPIADFIADIITTSPGNLVQFTFTGTLGNAPDTFQWDFGDGTANVTVSNPSHQYAVAGNYTVILTITDLDGEESTRKRQNYIYIDILPEASINANATAIYLNEWVLFTFNGTAGNLPITCRWDFDDGTSYAYGQNITHQFTRADRFEVVLLVTDADGDTSSDSLFIDVTVPTISPGIPGYSIPFLMITTFVAIIWFASGGARKKSFR